MTVAITCGTRAMVVTTVNSPTGALDETRRIGRVFDFDLIVIGDEGAPTLCWDEYHFIGIEEQEAMRFRLAGILPRRHYARKNLGYLLGISGGASSLFETDDDNEPLGTWRPRQERTWAQAFGGEGWVNIYRYYTDRNVWPRGFPLERLGSAWRPASLGERQDVAAPVQQGLANGSPDVDAVWRLTQDAEVIFSDLGSVLLGAGSWCPFNSQSTWWFPAAYPLMYLPSHVSFRMTDIWRSFVAQRCLWAMGYGVVFHGPEMYQDRNPHNLLRDFELEVPGYLHNARICHLLEDLSLAAGVENAGANLHRCYVALVRDGVVPQAEMDLVEAWLDDVERLSGSLTKAVPES